MNRLFQGESSVENEEWIDSARQKKYPPQRRHQMKMLDILFKRVWKLNARWAKRLVPWLNLRVTLSNLPEPKSFWDIDGKLIRNKK